MLPTTLNAASCAAIAKRNTEQSAKEYASSQNRALESASKAFFERLRKDLTDGYNVIRIREHYDWRLDAEHTAMFMKEIRNAFPSGLSTDMWNYPTLTVGGGGDSRPA